MSDQQKAGTGVTPCSTPTLLASWLMPEAAGCRLASIREHDREGGWHEFQHSS